MGSRSVRLLLQTMETGRRRRPAPRVQPQLIVRASTAAPPGSGR